MPLPRRRARGMCVVPPIVGHRAGRAIRGSSGLLAGNSSRPPCGLTAALVRVSADAATAAPSYVLRRGQEEASMSVRVAINGFGRTGRAAFRAAYEREAPIDWVAINDVADPAMLAHLLRYDTVYGPFPGAVEATEGAIVVDGVEIPVPGETDPALLPWAELGVEVAIESTGLFRARAGAQKHLEAGARKVIVS